MTDTYPNGYPAPWYSDNTPVMRESLQALFEHLYEKTPHLAQEHFDRIRAYCEYYILAPNWVVQDTEPLRELYATLNELRTSIKTLKTTQELDQWLNKCVTCGLDPL